LTNGPKHLPLTELRSGRVRTFGAALPARFKERWFGSHPAELGVRTANDGSGAHKRHSAHIGGEDRGETAAVAHAGSPTRRKASLNAARISGLAKGAEVIEPIVN
jgi:hypothetical protein